MPRTYSDDFRRAVIAYVEQGHSCHATARIFAASPSFVIKLMQQYRQTGRISGLPRGGVRHAKLTPFLGDVMGWITAQPDITLREMALRLQDLFGLTASSSGLSDMLRKAGYTYKKIHAGQRGCAWQASKTAR